MAREPDDLILAQLREMRKEIQLAVEASQSCMRSVARMFDRFAEFHDEIMSLRVEMTAFRAETRKSLIKIEGDIVLLENQNISRHGETLLALKRIKALEVAHVTAAKSRTATKTRTMSRGSLSRKRPANASE